MDIATGLVSVGELSPASARSSIHQRRSTMKWTTPECIEWRFGFEITLYIANR
jgi:pyrroloquinoline quinone biosynthesis protein A